ncbi:MAG: ABC transporter permease [Treponema sp.]|nr:ABC transporter permease [Treponema sp.]
MRVKLASLAAICVFLCLTGLCVTAFLAGEDRDLFFVLPSETVSPRFDVQAIEEFSEKEFLLSYEIPGAERIGLTYAEYSATVIATNSSYPGILGLNMLEGAFFSKQAWTGKQRHAVLNKTAAFTIFGSGDIVGSRFRLRNDTWLVTGVISDGDEDKARIYIPSSVRGGETGALAVMGGINEMYAKNGLKTLGIQEGNFSFINLGTQCRLLWERAEVTLLLFFAFLFLGIFKHLTAGFAEAATALKRDLSRLYPAELLRKNRGTVTRSVSFTLGMVLFPVMALFLFLRLASVCLPWQDIPSLSNLNPGFFFLRLSRIRVLKLISRFFFGFSLAFILIFFIGLIVSPTKRKIRRESALQ